MCGMLMGGVGGGFERRYQKYFSTSVDAMNNNYTPPKKCSFLFKKKKKVLM